MHVVFYILSCSCPYTSVTMSHKSRLMRTHIIHTTLLTLFHSDTFRPSKGHLQGVRQIHFNSNVCKMISTLQIQLSEQRVINYAAGT